MGEDCAHEPAGNRQHHRLHELVRVETENARLSGDPEFSRI